MFGPASDVALRPDDISAFDENVCGVRNTDLRIMSNFSYLAWSEESLYDLIVYFKFNAELCKHARVKIINVAAILDDLFKTLESACQCGMLYIGMEFMICVGAK